MRTASRLLVLALAPPAQAQSDKPAAPPAPAPALNASALTPSASTFAVTVPSPRGDLTFDLTSRRTAAEEGGRAVWMFTLSATIMPGVALADTLVADRTTLAPLRRASQTGPGMARLAYLPNKVQGEVAAGGEPTRVSVALDRPLDLDGGALQTAFAVLPLAPRYRAEFFGFDVQAQQPTTYAVEVTGMESVSVPAGTFDAFVVRTTEGSGADAQVSTTWVDQETRAVVKGERPQSGGATMTFVLKAGG